MCNGSVISHFAPCKDTRFGSSRPWRDKRAIAILASLALNHKARGFGLLGRSGRRNNPDKPQITVMIELMMKSHLDCVRYGVRFMLVYLPPARNAVAILHRTADRSLHCARQHAPHGLTAMIEAHAFGELIRRVPMHCQTESQSLRTQQEQVD
jgi:hypothetical protein